MMLSCSESHTWTSTRTLPFGDLTLMKKSDGASNLFLHDVSEKMSKKISTYFQIMGRPMPKPCERLKFKVVNLAICPFTHR